MNEEILCPKCGSSQITANKKGFSGKKAVAGAVLTGGIGLLAGTIGSNKIKITCLNCGHEFKPGEQLKQNHIIDYKESEVKFVGSEPTKRYKCSNCKNIASIGSNKTCPKCGYRVKDADVFIENYSSNTKSSLIVWLIIICILLVIFYLIFK